MSIPSTTMASAMTSPLAQVGRSSACVDPAARPTAALAPDPPLYRIAGPEQRSARSPGR